MQKSAERTLEDIEKEILETKEALKNVHGTETEVYARIVGYYRAVKHWNKGKRDEFDHRKMFSINNNNATLENYVQPTENTSTVNNKIETPSNELFTQDSAYYELFTRKTCPNCPPVKEFVSNLNMEGKNFDVDSEEGFSKATKKGVFASPTVIFYDNEGNETSRFHNVEELEMHFNKVEITA